MCRESEKREKKKRKRAREKQTESYILYHSILCLALLCFSVPYCAIR